MSQNPTEYDRLERHLEINHFELSDLESRRAFSLLTLAQETKMVVTATGYSSKLKLSFKRGRWNIVRTLYTVEAA